MDLLEYNNINSNFSKMFNNLYLRNLQDLKFAVRTLEDYFTDNAEELNEMFEKETIKVIRAEGN